MSAKNNVNTLIEKLVAIEKKARTCFYSYSDQGLSKAMENNNSRLNQYRHQWETIHEQVKNTPEWIDFCKKNDLVTHYNFGDVIA